MYLTLCNIFLSRFTIRFFLFICAICYFNQTNAQLKADFTVDNKAGCSPLNVKFTNATTGASASATWSWAFGNGNTSTLKDPGATYFTEKTYTVTLTVKDGANTSTKTMDITVYKKPTVDFSVSPAKGCIPLTASFVANATAGDGTIAKYLWDFGDGATVQGANYATTSHDYVFPQKPPVTLSVTNSFGCYTSVTKSNLIEAVKAVAASFTTSAQSLCNTGESITFNNTSTGSGTLTYAWDFGDGQTSTDASPTHAYNTKGTFIAKLTVTSSDGCAASVQSQPINVANFTADFTIPDKICVGQSFTVTNNSTQPFDGVEWYLDNGQYGNYGNGNLITAVYQSGDHPIKLIMYYGNCSVTVTKTLTVNDVPSVNGFISDLQGSCGVPLTINYKDTTSGAVAWEWSNSYNGNVFSTSQSTSRTYTSGNYDYVYLTVKNAAGCSSSIYKYINYEKPTVYIYNTNASPYQGCTGLKVSFAASPDTIIKSYQWNFGDGSAVDTTATPEHTYTKPGVYSVYLDYVTTNGCTGRAANYASIYVVDKPKFDFTSLNGTEICGNTPFNMQATPIVSGYNYYWYFNDTTFYNYYGQGTLNLQLNYDTTYTVKLIAENHGCADTVIKTDYIKVLPPFKRYISALNTCEGNRGNVRFIETSYKAKQWHWDFGDGGTDDYTSYKDTIRHTYNNTGAYKVVLSITNGGCTLKDSTIAYVLLKQKPVLTLANTSACSSDLVNFKLGGLQSTPVPHVGYYYGYIYSNIQYGDSTSGYNNNLYYNNEFDTVLNGTLQNLDATKSDIRMISYSYYFGCYDTSNFVPLKIHGPIAGFKVEPHSGCFKDAVSFTDTSRKFGNTNLIKWEWNFGDGKTQVLTSGGSVTHKYSNPGYYYVTLKVTDADGCSNQTTSYQYTVQVSGPKADFYASSYNVPPNSTVNFYNNSDRYNSYGYDAFQWVFSDGTTSNNDYPTFTYTDEGVYPVKLIGTNLSTGCYDTIVKNITVRKVNSIFTYTFAYINNNQCPPVITTFTSSSTNAVRVAWDFGDGGTAGNQTVVAHTYNNAGIYRVVHYSYDSNNGVDSTEDFIEVKGPYALMTADTLYACQSLQVTLSAEVKYASQFTWDFGDGTVIPGTDTFAVHNYTTPGIYNPALILKDAGGCNATSVLPQQVIVDSLSISFNVLPDQLCDNGWSSFTPQVNSLSNSVLQSPLIYNWITSENGNSDVSSNETASHYFSSLGNHLVNLTVSSAYGCLQTVTKTVTVNQGVTAEISGPQKICTGDTALFKGSAIPNLNSLSWKWNLGDGISSNLQNPAARKFDVQGTKQIELIVANSNCADTAYFSIQVNPHPVVSFIPAAPFVCKGTATTVTAAGGINYQWSSVNSFTIVAAGVISPNVFSSANYRVTVTDIEGCSTLDSVFVKVIEPTKLTVPPSQFACEGSPVQLNASGADKYQWIKNTTGLSNSNIANPVVTPSVSTTYTIVGADNYNCFTDTADVFVRISALPKVNAGADQQLIAGASVSLNAQVSGAVNWLWTPADYLSCNTCLNPVSTPLASTTYTLTAYNADGCTQKDEVVVSLLCKNNLVFIPNAFSPNDDGRNDRFVIKGSGIKSIRSIVIFSRWGKKMFGRKNININDRNNSWDGRVNGEPMPPGAYVYQIQTECEGGDIFNYSGTLMLVR